jgi:hypothetical protein
MNAISRNGKQFTVRCLKNNEEIAIESVSQDTIECVTRGPMNIEQKDLSDHEVQPAEERCES